MELPVSLAQVRVGLAFAGLSALETAASKMDRSPSFVEEMFAYGEGQAEELLKGLP